MAQFTLKKLFFGVVFAFVDSQLPLGFDAAAFTCVLAFYQWGKLKERAFGAKGTRVLCLSLTLSSFV